jgi:hypothetical protein
MTPWLQVAVLVAPFAVLGSLVAWAIVTIGNGTRPRDTSAPHLATPPATQNTPRITSATPAFGGNVTRPL